MNMIALYPFLLARLHYLEKLSKETDRNIASHLAHAA